ncbi:large membrane associated protein, partial [Cryobacterium sp. RTC2.1]|nr:large membrane associated protein [Cryobacterium sp. RTC2.1]
PTPTPAPTAAQPVGVHAWQTLFGGECLQPYVSPWEETFTVADCAAPHQAQLVYRGLFPGDATTPFPGEAALAAQINLLCSAPGVIDLTAAAAYPDVQVQGSYPITAAQWADAPHQYFCFVSRSSGDGITGSLAGPGPTA